MKLLLSEAKTMVDGAGFFEDLPLFDDKAKKLFERLAGYSQDDLKAMYKCNDKIVLQNVLRYQDDNRKMAIQRFSGLQYKYLDYASLNDAAKAFALDHIIILSSLYGLLRPRDGIRSYRMDFLVKWDINLYDYWHDTVASALQGDVLINLASQEYASLIKPFCRTLDIVFVQEKNGKQSTPSTLAKMARGLFARYVCENQIDSVEDLKAFKALGLSFASKASDEDHLVFVCKAETDVSNL